MEQTIETRLKLDHLAGELATRIQAFLVVEDIWLPVARYAQLHGLSEKTVRRAIEEGCITEQNGGLAPGGSGYKARKRIHRFFDIQAGGVFWPGG